MPKAISDTSPLLYLYRIDATEWLPQLFDEVWIPQAVREELKRGQEKGYSVPRTGEYPWARFENPGATPSEWLALDLGPGELAAMALALENPKHIILLDDMLARRTAQSAGLTVWGTLKIVLEAKEQDLIDKIKPFVERLDHAGMWLSQDIKRRILALAGEIISD